MICMRNPNNLITLLIVPFKPIILYHGFFSIWWCYVMWNKENLNPKPSGLTYVLMVNLLYLLSQFFWVWGLISLGWFFAWPLWVTMSLGLTVSCAAAIYAYDVVNA